MKSRAGETAEKLRGAYYTPAPIAEYLARWALAGEPARVLEPCCGDGAFLRAMAAGRRARNPSFVVDAVELDARAASSARALEATLAARGAVLSVAHGEFFAWLAAQPASARWDAVVGNPPYVRYQYLDDAQRARATAACARAGVALSKRTNAWVPFVVASLARLAPGGRLAMVVPAEILHVLHADGLRRLLEREARAVALVHLRAMVFPGVLQGVVLLMATRRRDDEPRGAPSRRDDDAESAGATRLRVFDAEDLASLPSHEVLDGRDAAADTSPASALDGRWTRALLGPHESAVLGRAERGAWARRFTDVASVDIGVVTGANEFFLTDRETVARQALGPYARPAFGRSEHARGVVYTRDDHEANARAGRSVFLLELPARPASRLPRAVRDYLARGEAAGLPARYKCRIREPWWRVPYVWPAPVAMLKRCHGYPRLVLNTFGACTTDTAYRVRLAPEYASRGADVVFSFVNSLTFLLAELEGRSYGGGVLEMVPSEIERLRVPLAPAGEEHFARLDGLVRAGAPAEEIVAFTDPLTLGRDGVGRMGADAIATLRGAWLRLRDRRLRVPRAG